jgi:alkylhydroperoxidase family enzyme
MQHGASAEKVEAALGDYRKSPLLSERERAALELAERMTYTNKRVTDRFFKRLKRYFSDEELVELAAIVALENFRSKFNPVFAIESQNFCPVPAVRHVAAEATRRLHR